MAAKNGPIRILSCPKNFLVSYYKTSNAIILMIFYSLQHSETVDVSHVFLPLTNAELSTLKQVRFFGPPCI